MIGCGYSSAETCSFWPAPNVSALPALGGIFEARSRPPAKNLKPIFTIKFEVGQLVLLANMLSVANNFFVKLVERRQTYAKAELLKRSVGETGAEAQR